MAIQTKVTLNHEKGYAGQIVDLQLCNKISVLNTTSDMWRYGTPVNYPGTEIFAGLVVRTITDINYNPALGAGINPGHDASVMTDGVMYVEAPNAVKIGDPVYIDGGKLVETGETAVPNASYVSVGAKGELVKLKLTIGG